MGYKTTYIDGDLALGRNADVGGDVNIHGMARVKRHLKVEGFLDAPNIKGALKGFFRNEDELQKEFPKPRPGWMAIVLEGESVERGFVHVVKDGAWEQVGEEAKPLELVIDSLNVYSTKTELVSTEEELLKRLQGVSENSNASTDPFKFLGDFNSIEDLEGVLDGMMSSVKNYVGIFRAVVDTRVITVVNNPISAGHGEYNQMIMGCLRIKDDGTLEQHGQNFNVLYRISYNGEWLKWNIANNKIIEEMHNTLKDSIDNEAARAKAAEEELLKRLQGVSENSNASTDPFKFLGAFESLDKLIEKLDTLHNIEGGESSAVHNGHFRAVIGSNLVDINNEVDGYVSDRWSQVITTSSVLVNEVGVTELSYNTPEPTHKYRKFTRTQKFEILNKYDEANVIKRYARTCNGGVWSDWREVSGQYTNSPNYGKRIALFGGSFAQNMAVNSSDYQFDYKGQKTNLLPYIADRLGATAFDCYAVGGQGMMAADKENGGKFYVPLIKQLQTAGAGYDVYIIMGGINDYGQNVPLGTSNGAADDTTYCGGLKKAFDWIKVANPDARIYTITPFKAFDNGTNNHQDRYWNPRTNIKNADGHTFYEYVQAQKEVAQIHGVPSFDLWANQQFSGAQASKYYISDYTHPNGKGYQAVADALVEFLAYGLGSGVVDVQALVSPEIAAETSRAEQAEKNLADKITAEIRRAEAAERANAKLISDLIGESPETLDSIHEISSWILNDTTGAAAMTKNINENENTIAKEVQRAKEAEKEISDNFNALALDVEGLQNSIPNIKNEAARFDGNTFSATANEVKLTTTGVNISKQWTVSLPAATEKNAGAMSADDKRKLNAVSKRVDVLEGIQTDFRDMLNVTSQSEFDEMIAALRNGTPVTASIHKGEYYMKPTTFGASAELFGNEGVVIKQRSSRFSKNDAASVDDTHYRCSLDNSDGITIGIPPFSAFVANNNNIEVAELECYTSRKIVDEYNNVASDIKIGKKFKLEAPDGFVLEEEQSIYGWYGSAWITAKFVVDGVEDMEVDKIENGEVVKDDNGNVIKEIVTYLICMQISDPTVANPNSDITLYKDNISYVLCNTSKSPNKIYYDSDNIYIPLWCESVDVVETTGSIYSTSTKPLIKTSYSLTMSNITLRDCTAGIVFTQGHKDANGNEVKSVLNLYNCRVRNIPYYAVKVYTYLDSEVVTPSVIDSCDFADCAFFAGKVVDIQGWSSSDYTEKYVKEADKNFRVKIKDTKIKQVDRTQYKNTASGIIVNSNCEITNCDISNCVSGGLSLGYGNIVVKGCTIYNDDRFNARRKRWYSRDFGAIYCNGLTTSNEEAMQNIVMANKQHTILIDGCRIYGYTTQGSDGHGIYIDVGRGDVTCVNNSMSAVGMYSIYSRFVNGEGGIEISQSSIRNRIENNLLMSPYYIQYGNKVADTDKFTPTGNYVLSSSVNTTPIDATDIVVDDLYDEGEFIVCKNRDLLVYSTNSTTRGLRTFPGVVIKNSKPRTEYSGYWGLNGVDKKDLVFKIKLPNKNKNSFNLKIRATNKFSWDIDGVVSGVFQTTVKDDKGNDIEITTRNININASSTSLPLTIIRAYVNNDASELYIRLNLFTFKGWYSGTLDVIYEFSDNIVVTSFVENFDTAKIKGIYSIIAIGKNILNQYFYSIDNKEFFKAVQPFYIYIPDVELVDGTKKYKFNKLGLHLTSGPDDTRPEIYDKTYLEILMTGFVYFDTSLHKPIWWTNKDGAWIWVDAAGVEVAKVGFITDPKEK